MITYIVLGVVAVIVVLLLVVASRPADFRVVRSASFAATPATLFDYVNDLHKWNDWSPWAKMDPDSKITYSGPVAGQGASFSWAGGKKVGEGRMTITRSEPVERVINKLEFMKPFVATNTVEFTFLPEGDRTKMTWDMSGRNGFMGKAFGLIMNCDKMCGGQFEQGFANLRAIVETPVSV